MRNSLYILLAGSFKKRGLSENSEAQGIIVYTMVTSDELFVPTIYFKILNGSRDPDQVGVAKSFLKAATGDMQ